MTQKETNVRSVVFLVMGILLLFSLVLCVYIVNTEKDLVQTSAQVTEVKKDKDGTGKSDVTVTYDVDGQPYQYSYYEKKDLKEGDKVTLYYHGKNPGTVQSFKTPKLIFIMPVIGLALCILGLFELFKKDEDSVEEIFETAVIGVVGNTQQLKIVTDEAEVQEYEKTPEEEAEAPVKEIKREEVAPVVEEQPVVEEPAPVVEETTVVEEVPEPIPAPVVVEQPVVEQPVVEPVAVLEEVAPVMEEVVTPVTDIPNVSELPQEEVVTPVNQNAVAVTELPKENVSQEVAPVVAPVIPQPEVKSVVQQESPTQKVEDAIMEKVKETPSTSTGLSEDDIKKVIKDVLKEVIQEVKTEPKKEEPIVQKRVIPNYYYIAGTSLIYEEAGKDAQEVELKTIKSIVRTVNSAGNVVKLVVSNERIKCVLTNMKNIDLEQLAGLLNNKMRTIDDEFKEEIEYKEY